ncbi:Uu.00g058160.m01.CDS01 [Anthostomella pinea]|uniref:Inositol-pentakisphosphate 2-kinase n=1 Tax=Anthostomella pinea TaxID=933095 RepID=A0AAI8YJU5_9PEZI|nr:Uu.00g058160.m01.CDS01 [Anthostomella pinea]
MHNIWDKLSKPLPAEADAEEVEPVITAKEREDLIAKLEKYEFQYLAEGRANVVFTIKDVQDPAAPNGLFAGTLVRVPKATPGVTPCDYETLQNFHEKLVEVHVGREHIVPQLLVKISEGIASTLNAKRGHRDDDGSVIRAGYAMLIQDMSPSPGDHLALEFKPKWLAQSPLAPADATRCRTCAREAFRNGQKQAQGKTISTPICPLGLRHANRAVVMSTMDRLAPKWSERDRERLADALRESGVLERLRALQMRGDPDRALFADPGNAYFGLAMTLRDCSCFVRMPVDEKAGEPVVVKLADVDKKNWEEKQTYWQDSHNNLVDNGWYTGEEKVDGPPIETACVLRLDYCLENGMVDDVPAPFRERLGHRF